MPKNIWVFPELSGEAEINKSSLGLLNEARAIAEKVGGAITAIAFGDEYHDYAEVLSRHEVSQLYFFKDPLLKYFSAEASAAALLPKIRDEKPWLFIMGDTVEGRELAPRLAALLNTGLVTGCVKIDLSDPEKPVFYRPVYAGQLFEEIVSPSGKTMLITTGQSAPDLKPAAAVARVETIIIEPRLSAESAKAKHIAYLSADFQKGDVAEAPTVVAAGMGAIDPFIFPLVEELAVLLEGTIGTTRPVVDTGKVSRERLIGQTGKVVAPDFYLALGVSGASHHVGGIQDSRKIVAINRDPQAPIFRSVDAGAVGDLRDVLPKLIARIKKAKTDGEIL